jgi:hypothetical protein
VHCLQHLKNMLAVALCQDMLELYELQHALWAMMLPAIFHFIQELLHTVKKYIFFQSAVFIFVNELTLPIPLVVSNQLIRNIAEV